MPQKAYLHVDYVQPEELVFNRARMRRAFVKIGQVHMRDARRLVMKRGRSKPGENPSYRTGQLARSIGYYVPRASKKRPGLMVKIAPNQKNGEGNRHINGAFYPAFLFYGVRRGAKRKKGHHRGASGGSGWRVEPRNNYMTEVLDKRRSWTRYVLSRELRKSLRPQRRKKKMKLTPIIAALRSRCPRFENRVGGAAQFKAIPEAGKLRLPAAYVVPAEDVTGEQKSQTDYWQDLTEGFSVIVVLSNERDEKGQWASYDAVHDVRQEIWKALLGWEPDPQAHEIQYTGGMLLDLNRHELYYQFDFTVKYEITETDTRQQDDLDGLPDLKTLSIDVDFIEPGTGPDGDIEHHTEITFQE